MNATKEKIDHGAAKKLLASHSTVVVAKGKKVLTFDLKSSDVEEVLGVIMGRSGNLRAPSISHKSTLVVGFTEEMYANQLD